jgi:flagellar biosynthetic protein FliQ
MNEVDALELVRATVWTILVGSGPPVVAAVIVGLVVAVLQALTQIQEMTLTFIPKIIVIFIVLTFCAQFIGGQIFTFSEHVYGRIEKGF